MILSLVAALVTCSVVLAVTDYSPQRYDGKIYRVALGSGTAPSAAEAALIGIKTGDMVENTDDGVLYIMHATNVYTKFTAAGTVTLTAMSVPLASNKLYIGNASGIANEKTLSGLFTTGTGGVVTATTTGSAITNSSATVTAGSLSVSTNATATATVTASSLSVSTNATATATVTAGSLSVSTNATATVAMTPQAPGAVTPTITVTAQRPGAQTPTITVTPETGAVTASGVNNLITPTVTVTIYTTTGYDSLGLAISNAAGETLAIMTNATATCSPDLASNAVVVVTVTGGGAVMTNATAVSSALLDYATNATAVSSALPDFATNSTGIITVTAQNTTLDYAATNAPAVTVTAQNTTLNYAATNDPAITVSAQNTTLNYAATNAPTVTSQTATFVKP